MSQLPPSVYDEPSSTPVREGSSGVARLLNRERSGDTEDASDGDNEVPEQTREKLLNLKKEMEGLSSFKGSRRISRPTASISTSSGTSDLEPSPSIPSVLTPPSPTSQLLPPAPTTSSSSKRRTAKNPNVERRNHDIEFATEIGQHLLVEVRKYHGMLQEKEDIIKQLEIAKAEFERANEILQRQLRQTQESEEKYKAEVWQLELTKQELGNQIAELESNLQRATTEGNRLGKQLNAAGEQVETLKASEESLTQSIEAAKVRYETDMGALRRNFAGAQRDKAELQKKIEDLQNDLDLANKRIKPRPRPADGEEDGDLVDNVPGPEGPMPTVLHGDGSPSTTPPASPMRSPRRQFLEAETLKASLSHAHAMIDKLRGSLHKEQVEKDELKKLLDERQEDLETLRHESLFEPSTSQANMPRRSGRGRRVRKRGGGNVDSEDDGHGDPIDELMNRPDVPSRLGADDDDDEYCGSDGEALGISSPFGRFGKEHTLTDGLPRRDLLSELGNSTGSGQGMNKEFVDTAVNTDPWLLQPQNDGPTSPTQGRLTRAEAEAMRDAAVAAALAKEREIKAHAGAVSRPSQSQDQDSRRHTFGGEYSDPELEDAFGLRNPTNPKDATTTRRPPSSQEEDGFVLVPPPRLSTDPLPARSVPRASAVQHKRPSIEDVFHHKATSKPVRPSLVPGATGPTRSNSVSTSSTDASNDQRHSLAEVMHSRSELDSEHGGSGSAIIAAITKTMIGEYLYKHTRRTVGGGLSERKHQRFFWVHPYTKTLYWSTQEPGTEGATEKAKSAYITAVEAIPSDGGSSLLIKTPHRNIKITAPSKQCHDVWYQSLTYLLSQGGGRPYESSTVTDEPFGQTTRSVRKKSSFNNVSSIFNPPRGRELSATRDRTVLPRSDGPTDMTPDLFDDETRFDDERPENVFQCCDGKHDVSTLERDHHHHHHHHSHHYHAGKRFERVPS